MLNSFVRGRGKKVRSEGYVEFEIWLENASLNERKNVAMICGISWAIILAILTCMLILLLRQLSLSPL